ncbi:MAG: lytic transglycosylase [Betaproteobacteria bacterium]|nr:lytic transglycosylase [Betaproteobacteria bacterium]
MAGFAEDNAQITEASVTRSDGGSTGFVGLPAAGVAPTHAPAHSPDLRAVLAAADLKAAVQLGVKYAHAEGVPRDQQKAHQLFCHAARYGDADGLYNLGWMYANGRGVTHDDAVAAALFSRAADRGHAHAQRLLEVVRLRDDAALPACVQPAALPVAKLPPPRPGAVQEALAEQRIPMAPREIMQLVQKLAPQYEVDTNLVLALISVESAFNPNALSHARAQGLMQLIPETAERFGVKNPFKPDENIRGGLAYLRWLLAYFQGDVPLVLAAYNAGEGAVEKFRGIPPYNETQNYVRKITGMYQRLTHPYNSSVVGPSPVISQLRQQRTM